MKLIIEKTESRKTKREYVRAYIDLGYKIKIVAVGDLECAELAGCLPVQMHEKLRNGNKIIL